MPAINQLKPQVATVKDDLFGKLRIELPAGYRHVTSREFVRRWRKCQRAEANDEGETGWEDLDGVSLYDSETKQLMSISCSPNRWRIFVEAITDASELEVNDAND